MSQIRQNLYIYLIGATIFVLLTGTIFYHIVEKLSWLNSYYFSVITLATVGYGDITPKTDLGKIFTTFYIFVGVGIITTFLSVSMKRFGRRVERRQIKRNGGSRRK